MQFAQNQIVRWGLAMVLCAPTGCEEWPRHKHKPSVNNRALSPNQPPQDGLKVTWAGIENAEETNNQPGAAPHPINVGEGFHIEGTLSGLGWSPDESPDRLSECGEIRAFPPAAPGNYIGDIDWVTLQPQENGTLCLQLTSEIETARFDVPLYVLDECDEPISVFVQPDGETPIGLNVPSEGTQWAIPVEADTTLAVGLAGFFPDDDELDADWIMSLSLVPSVNGAGGSLCPEVR